MKTATYRVHPASCQWQFIAACVFAILGAPRPASGFTFDDIEFWVGSGANRAAMVVDWVENSTDQPALVWGYRWDGAATGYDMLVAIVKADDRLFAKLGTFDDTVVYGLGYDADNDGQFGVQKTTLGGVIIDTQFDEWGLAVSGIPDSDFRRGAATDPDDYYMEGWRTGFWHYGNESHDAQQLPTLPFAGGAWIENSTGFEERDLLDSAWDSWAFEMPAFPPPYTAYAEGPAAAASPFAPGDFNRDGMIGADDYEIWKSHYGSTAHPAIDGNLDGIVDAADYTLWRNNFVAETPGPPLGAGSAVNVPEPTTLSLAASALCIVLTIWFLRRTGDFS